MVFSRLTEDDLLALPAQFSGRGGPTGTGARDDNVRLHDSSRFRHGACSFPPKDRASRQLRPE